MQIEEGKYYICRDRKIVGPITINHGRWRGTHPFIVNGISYDQQGYVGYNQDSSELDLVAEIPTLYDKDTEIERLKAELNCWETNWKLAEDDANTLRARLAEAETRIAELSPKPVVMTELVKVSRLDGHTMFNLSHDRGKAGELAITFHDGELKTSQVKQPDGSWK